MSLNDPVFSMIRDAYCSGKFDSSLDAFRAVVKNPELVLVPVETCPNCNGKGVVGRCYPVDTTCPRCKGVGFVLHSPIPTLDLEVEEKPCPTCNGSGQHPNPPARAIWPIPCPDCDGTGVRGGTDG